MKRMTFLLFTFLLALNGCGLFSIVEEFRPIETCESNSSNIPSLEIVWEYDLINDFDAFFSPIIYKDYVLYGHEDSLIFLNKTTGAYEKSITVDFPILQNISPPTFADVFDGSCYIEDDYLFFNRFYSGGCSYDNCDTIYTEYVHLETGDISTLFKKGYFGDAPTNHSRRISLFENSFMRYNYQIMGMTKLDLVNAFDGTITTIYNGSKGVINGNFLWKNNNGDTLITSVLERNQYVPIDWEEMIIQTYNFSKKEVEFNIKTHNRDLTEPIVFVKDDIIYLRLGSRIMAIDYASQSVLWEIEGLNNANYTYDGYEEMMHLYENYIIDFSKKEVSVIDRFTGELLWQFRNMPEGINAPRTIFHNNEMIIAHEGISRIDLNNACAIWQKEAPSNNIGFRTYKTGFNKGAIVDIDRTLGYLYAIQNEKLVCIRL